MTSQTSFVSSEFQTPLTTAKGSLETVLRHWSSLDDDRRRELVVRALRGCDDLVGALGQLQDVEGAGSLAPHLRR